MGKGLSVFGVLLLATLSLSAQGHNAGSSGAAGTHSNAPAGTPAASSDRDTGTARAADVGKGKQKGLQHKSRKKQQSKHS